jgi:hypothetical protein
MRLRTTAPPTDFDTMNPNRTAGNSAELSEYTTVLVAAAR